MLKRFTNDKLRLMYLMTDDQMFGWRKWCGDDDQAESMAIFLAWRILRMNVSNETLAKLGVEDMLRKIDALYHRPIRTSNQFPRRKK